MLYRIPSTSAIPEIGRNVAHGKRNAIERAFPAADLVCGRVTFVRWTVRQAAAIAGVCRPYATAAIAVGDDRNSRIDILTGQRPLRIPSKDSESLADHFCRSTAAERIAAARKIGPAVIWDAMVAPLI